MHLLRERAPARHNPLSGRTNAIRLDWLGSQIESLDQREQTGEPSCAATRSFVAPGKGNLLTLTPGMSPRVAADAPWRCSYRRMLRTFSPWLST